MSESADEVPRDPEPFPGFGLLRSERLYDSHWCGLRRDMVELPNGAEQEYHVFEIPDASVIVPRTSDGRIVMIGQYRYPHGRTHWEVPAGRIGDDETPLECARRELREEAGVEAREIAELPGFYPTNGISPHFAHAFLAEGCEVTHEPVLDDSEQIVARTFSEEEVRAMLRAGRIRDGFSAVALMYVLLFWKRGTR